MNASAAKTLGIIVVVLLVLMIAWPLKYLIFWPAGLAHGFFHGVHDWNTGWWPWIGLAGFFGLALLVFWIAVIVWVYKDAERRGMHGALWAIIVFFLHLIGLLIFVLVRSEHPLLAPGGRTAPPGCPRCGKAIERYHAFCPACGERLQPKCAKCGRDVQAGWQTCPHCGEKL